MLAAHNTWLKTLGQAEFKINFLNVQSLFKRLFNIIRVN